MSMEKKPSEPMDESAQASRTAARKPYQKPAFVREQVFETMALACGKINATSGACKAVKKNS
jgi:hypothetical protein